jgi:hypothetical protein
MEALMDRNTLFEMYAERPLSVPLDTVSLADIVHNEQVLANTTGKTRYVAHARSGDPVLLTIEPKPGSIR